MTHPHIALMQKLAQQLAAPAPVLAPVQVYKDPEGYTPPQDVHHDERGNKDPGHNSKEVWEESLNERDRMLRRLFGSMEPAAKADKALVAGLFDHEYDTGSSTLRKVASAFFGLMKTARNAEEILGGASHIEYLRGLPEEQFARLHHAGLSIGAEPHLAAGTALQLAKLTSPEDPHGFIAQQTPNFKMPAAPLPRPEHQYAPEQYTALQEQLHAPLPLSPAPAGYQRTAQAAQAAHPGTMAVPVSLPGQPPSGAMPAHTPLPKAPSSGPFPVPGLPAAAAAPAHMPGGVESPIAIMRRRAQSMAKPAKALGNALGKVVHASARYPSLSQQLANYL